MADVYEMPIPKPPTDAELDELAVHADTLLSRIDTPIAARQVIRVQATAIRKLRVALAKAEARAESVQAVADMRRDMEVAATTLDLVDEGCQGEGLPPEYDGRRGGPHCPICGNPVTLDGEQLVSAHADPPLRPA